VDPDPLVKDKASRSAAQRSGAASTETTGGGRVFEPFDFSANSKPTLNDLMRHARAVNASDLHISTGTVPQIRLYGCLVRCPWPRRP
jgi:hypothetical protein